MSATTGSFSIGDTTVQMPVKTGTLGPSVVDISKLYAQTGMFTYDPGFTSTASCESEITYIDGEEGVLLYRGYPIEQDFLETRSDAARGGTLRDRQPGVGLKPLQAAVAKSDCGERWRNAGSISRQARLAACFKAHVNRCLMLRFLKGVKFCY